MPAKVVPAVSSLLLLSCDAPLGNVSVAEPSVAGAAPPAQFWPLLQLLLAPPPVHVQDVQGGAGLSATAILTWLPTLPDHVPLKEVAVPCAEPSTMYPAAIESLGEPLSAVVLPYSSVKPAGSPFVN